MISPYIIYQLFDDEDLSKIDEFFLEESETYWEDGLRSTTHDNKNIKNNLELIGETDLYTNINKLVKQRIYKNKDFFNYTIPAESTSVIVSKTKPDGYYRVHHDSPALGNFSTTIFLSDKDSYTGGELVLNTGIELKEIKLDRGFAVTYNTGMCHAVNKVTGGERLAIVLWTTTLIRDNNLRHIYGEIKDIITSIQNKYPEELDIFDTNLDIKNVNNSLLFRLNSLADYVHRIGLR